MTLSVKPCCPLLKGDVANTGALSPSSLKYCCTVTQIFRLLYVFCTPGEVFTGVSAKTTVCWGTQSSTWNTTLSLHLLTHPTRGSQMTPQSGSLKQGLYIYDMMDTFSGDDLNVLCIGCPPKLCSCVLSSKEPSQQRVKRWAFGIDEVLKDPVGREQFLKFLESEFSSENLRCDEAHLFP